MSEFNPDQEIDQELDQYAGGSQTGFKTCVVSTKVFPICAGTIAILTLVLPQQVQDYWVAAQCEIGISDASGVITFPPFPQGAAVTLYIPSAGLSQQYILPYESTFEI